MEEGIKILVVDDEVNMLESLRDVLKRKGHTVATAIDGLEALERLGEDPHFDLIIADLKMPRMGGIELLERVHQDHPQMMVVMLTGYGTIDSAVESIKKGAYDYILKPFNPEEIFAIINRILERKRLVEENIYLLEELSRAYNFENIVGRSPPMEAICQQVITVAPTNSSVILYGESGTGKELLANAIHYLSPRRNRPFIKVSCASLPEGVLESELFGHERGAFTSAFSQRKGRFELADGGTLFLDEVGDLPPSTQVKLLRVLQTREFERVGGTETIRVDVRIISATNKNLEEEVRAQRFREDLFYRLNVIPIHIPPLRERKEDIPALAEHFLKLFAIETNKRIHAFTPEATELLVNYHWPGNIRELRNIIERVVVFCQGNTIGPQDLPLPGSGGVGDITLSLKEGSLSEAEKTLIQRVLQETGWNLSRTAQILKISRGTLYSKMERYGLRQREKGVS